MPLCEIFETIDNQKGLKSNRRKRSICVQIFISIKHCERFVVVAFCLCANVEQISDVVTNSTRICIQVLKNRLFLLITKTWSEHFRFECSQIAIAIEREIQRLRFELQYVWLAFPFPRKPNEYFSLFALIWATQQGYWTLFVEAAIFPYEINKCFNSFIHSSELYSRFGRFAYFASILSVQFQSIRISVNLCTNEEISIWFPF